MEPLMSHTTPIPQTSLRPPKPTNFRQSLGAGNNAQPKPPSTSQLNLSANTIKKGQLPAVGVSTA